MSSKGLWQRRFGTVMAIFNFNISGPKPVRGCACLFLCPAGISAGKWKGTISSFQRIFFRGFLWKRAISSTERGHFIAQDCKACNDYKIHALGLFLNSPCWRTPHPSIQILDLGICVYVSWHSWMYVCKYALLCIHTDTFQFWCAVVVMFIVLFVWFTSHTFSHVMYINRIM